MDAGKGQRLNLLGGPKQFSFLLGLPATELQPFVEEQVPRSLSVFHGEGGEGLILRMKLRHPLQIEGTDDVNIVHNERFFRTAGILQKEMSNFLQAAAGIKQDFLAGDDNPHAEVVVGFEILHDHVRKVMHVDDHFANSEGAQAREGDLQERAAGNFHQRFGALVGEGAQACAQAGGQNHRFHAAEPSSARCRTTTSTPSLPLRRFANCSAR